MERRWQVLAVVCVGVFVASLDLFIVNIAFPAIAADFAPTGLGALSWILNAYAIVLAALLIPAGRLADAVGRRRAFLTGMAVFTVASAACAAAPSVAFLVGARVVQAAGAALILPATLGLLLPEFSPAQRPTAIGLWAASGGVAAAAGPPVGGILVQASWHWVFLVNLPIGVAALVAGARILREVRDPDAQRPDLVGAALLIVGVGALIVGIVKGQDWGWDSLRVLGAFAVAAGSLGIVAARCRTHPSPIVEPAIVRVRAFTFAMTGAALFFMAFAAMLLGTVLFLTGVWGESTLHAGLMIAPGPLTAAAFSVPGARLGGRFGQRAVGVAGAGLMALGAAWWLTHLGTNVAYARDFLPGMVIGGVGVGFVNPSVTAAAAAALPPVRFATGAALITMARQLGSAVGVALLVAVLGPTPDAAAFDGAWIVMLVCAGSAAVTMAFMGARSDVPEAAPQATVVEVAA